MRDGFISGVIDSWLSVAELSMGRVNPWVGLGWVGLGWVENFRLVVGWVGLGPVA